MEQVNKTKAKELYKQGKTIYLQSSKLAPINPWSSAIPINVGDDLDFRPTEKEAKKVAGIDFTKRVNAFSYYTCQQNAYPHFYIDTLEK